MLLSCLFAPTVFSASHHEAKAHEDKGWLADLNGLPSRDEIEKLSLHVDTIMQHETHKNCTSINPRLRKMIFLHFALYQHIANKRSVYLDEKNVHHWAHVFGMLLKESSGDPTSVTSMTGRSYTTYESKSDLERWEKITKLSKNRAIPMNKQTNFGLTQLSVDRLFVALKLAQKPAILDGKKEADLNTAIAIRRLIWFYQDFAQGRLTQEHDRIHHHERGNPEYSTRFAFGTSMALLLCGTHYMFHEGYQEKAGGAADLTEAMTSIAYCKLGDSKDGYGLHEANATCFAKWVTLCPLLNFDIAMLTPPKYFATRNAAPVCEETFKALLIKKSVPNKKTSSTKKHHEPKQITHHPDKTLGSRVRGVLNTALTQLKNLLPKPAPKNR
jgi:hypothetical protein